MFGRRYSRLLAVALLLAGFWCLGQQDGRAQFNGCPPGICSGKAAAPAGGSLLLDTLSATAVSAVSSRKLRTAFAGNPIQAVIAGAGTLQNIPFNGSGDLDVSSGAGLNTFVGANTGGIATWYDQSPGGANPALYDATGAGARALVVRSGSVNNVQNTHVWGSGVAANNSFMSVALTQAQPYTIAMLARLDAGPSIQALLGSQFFGSHVSMGTASASRWDLFGGGLIVQPSGTADLNVHTFIAILNGASSSLSVDGVTVVSGNAGTDTMASVAFLDYSGDASIGEVLMFNSAIGAPDQAAIKASWVSYWAAPP
jgi:hypothetical protein